MNIWFDLDETLVHSYFLTEAYEGIRGIKTNHTEDGKNHFYVIKRQLTDQVIDLAQRTVGRNNVFLITLGFEEYVKKMFEMCEIDIRVENIFFKERWLKKIPTAYGGSYCLPWGGRGRNLLIDNLEFGYNQEKVQFLNLKKNDYLQIKEYFGNDLNDPFLNQVESFLEERTKNS